MTEAIEKDNLQYFRRSHLIFVDSGEQWQVIDDQGRARDVPLAKVTTKAEFQKELRKYEVEKANKEEIEAETENKKRKREEGKPTREAKKPATTPATIDQAQLDKANSTVATQQGALTELRRMYQSLEEKNTSMSKELKTVNSELDRVKKDYQDKVAEVAVQKENLVREKQHQDTTFHRTQANMQQNERVLTLALNAHDELKKAHDELKNANDELKKKLQALNVNTPAMAVPGSTADTADREHEITTLKAENQSLKTECRTLTLEYKTLEDKNRALAARVEDLDSKKSSMESYMLHKANEFRRFADDMTDRVNGAGRFQDLDDPYTIAQVYVPVEKEPVPVKEPVPFKKEPYTKETPISEAMEAYRTL